LFSGFNHLFIHSFSFPAENLTLPKSIPFVCEKFSFILIVFI